MLSWKNGGNGARDVRPPGDYVQAVAIDRSSSRDGIRAAKMAKLEGARPVRHYHPCPMKKTSARVCSLEAMPNLDFFPLAALAELFIYQNLQITRREQRGGKIVFSMVSIEHRSQHNGLRSQSDDFRIEGAY